jgi:hypothetical protein
MAALRSVFIICICFLFAACVQSRGTKAMSPVDEQLWWNRYNRKCEVCRLVLKTYVSEINAESMSMHMSKRKGKGNVVNGIEVNFSSSCKLGF